MPTNPGGPIRLIGLCGLLLIATGPDPAQARQDAPQPSQKRGSTADDPHSPWGKGVHDGIYMGRELAQVMSWLGADWLVRPDREAEEQPERMLDALELRPGMTVADIGTGVGYTTMRLARRVGETGKVYATDIQPEMIRLLKENLAGAGLRHVKPILCTPQEPGLPEGEIDLAIMVDVYHECSHPVETLRGIYKALKPGGKLVLVEFRAEDPEVPIRPEHKMTAAQVRKELEPQGFVFEKAHEFLPWQHILIYEKPERPNPEKAAPAENSPSSP